MTKLKVGRYREDFTNDLLYVLKVRGARVLYYWEHSNGKLYNGFTRDGVWYNLGNFRPENYKRIDFNAYLEKLCE